MKKIVKASLVIVIILATMSHCSMRNDQNETIPITLPENSIINLYDAFGERNEALIKDFGFSCLITFNGKTILFDGGTNADIFKNNVEALNIDLGKVDFVVASHAHFDHINGFDYLLTVNPNVKIYFPEDIYWGANFNFNLTGPDSTIANSLPQSMQYFEGDYEDYRFRQTGRFWNANMEFVSENLELEPGIKLISTTSPFMGYFNKYPSLKSNDESTDHQANFNGLRELSLSLETPKGEVLFVGCSHSTLEKIIEATMEFTSNDIQLVYGGYHLLPYNHVALNQLADRLKNKLSVNKVAPAHCTGHLAFKALQEKFEEDYIFAGLGEIINF